MVIRPHIVAGGFLGYLLGALLALTHGAEFSPAPFTLGYIIVLLGDLSTHYSNNYHDTEIDAATPGKTFGNTNILVSHPEARVPALNAAVLMSISSLLISSFMVLLFELPLTLPILVTATSILGWLYSTPHVQLNANYLGETAIALGTGFAVPAVSYLCLYGSLSLSFLMFIAPMVLYGYILSLSLELPDMETDREFGRKNLVVLLNRRFTSIMILLLSIAAFTFFRLGVAPNTHNPLIIQVITLIPVVSSLLGLVQSSYSQEDADKLSTINILSLFFTLLFLNIFLILQLIP